MVVFVCSRDARPPFGAHPYYAKHKVSDVSFLIGMTILKHNRLYELDIHNLIEELEDLGSEKRNAVES